MSPDFPTRRIAVQRALAFFSLSRLGTPAEPHRRASLNGAWRFRLDPGDEGIANGWWREQLPDTLRLPGSLQEQGFGDRVTAQTRWMANPVRKMKKYPSWFLDPLYERYRQPDNLRFPYWLQPDRHYIGAAWYQRTVEIPEECSKKRCVLFLERCHWGTRVWLDNREIGSEDSLATPHIYDLASPPPGTHTITIRVDNRMLVDIGLNAHSISDQTQTAWNGITGELSLYVTDPIWIDDIQLYPGRLRLTAANATGRSAEGHLDISIAGQVLRRSVTITAQPVTHYEIAFPLDRTLKSWDEFDPALHRLSVRLSAEKHTDGCELRFGLRDFHLDGTQFSINGRKTFLRGNVDCCVFPKTGYPSTDAAEWRSILQISKDHGLNHVRFHSWCPPEAAFEAADELGMYLMPEVDVWNSVVSKAQHDFLKKEARRILRWYGNHPSFVMFGLGNERDVAPEIMKDLISDWKQDSRRLYTGLANSRSWLPEYDFCVTGNYKGQRLRYHPAFTETGWFVTKTPQTTLDFRKAVELYDKPLVSHELVQYCSYPDLRQKASYTGSLHAGYLDIARDQLEANGMLEQAAHFVRASGKWQIELFKEEIEAALRTPGFGGFQLLGLHDFPGQGAALVGVLDAFWKSKGYVTAEQFRRFCAPTVPLALIEKRVFTADEPFRATLQLAHFGPAPLAAAAASWRILDMQNRELQVGSLPARRVPIGNHAELGAITVNLAPFVAPAKYRLELKVAGNTNHWDFWVFPANAPPLDTRGVKIVKRWDEYTVKLLREGAKVLLLASPRSLKGDYQQVFTPVYWDCPWTDGGESQTLGLLANPKHPLFSEFPTDGYTEWHWYELLVTARPLILDSWPKDYRPLIQIIDDWNRNHKLGVLAEARVGGGSLMVCTMDLELELASRPVARQLRTSLLNYMNTPAFRPKHELEAEEIAGLFRAED